MPKRVITQSKKKYAGKCSRIKIGRSASLEVLSYLVTKTKKFRPNSTVQKFSDEVKLSCKIRSQWQYRASKSSWILHDRLWFFKIGFYRYF